MARAYGNIGLGLGGVTILLIILIFISLCIRTSKVSANAIRFGALVPLACLVVVSAAAMVALGSIVMHSLNYGGGIGGGYNRLSPELQYFQLILGGHAFAAAWLTFWHVIKNSDTTRHTAAGHASVAVFLAFITTGLAINAVVMGDLEAVNTAGAIVTWVLNVLLLFLAVILMVSRDNAKEQTRTYYTAPPGVQMHYCTGGPVHVQPPQARAVQV